MLVLFHPWKQTMLIAIVLFINSFESAKCKTKSKKSVTSKRYWMLHKHAYNGIMGPELQNKENNLLIWQLS